MVKHKPQASPAQAEDAPQGTGHPLLAAMTQTDAFAQASKARAAVKEFQIAELETWKQTVAALAASPNGKLFIMSMVQHSGMHIPANYKDTLKMVEVRIKSSFYLEWVRPFIPPELRKDIET